MKIVGLMLVKNEAWCLGLSMRAALLWCDSLFVLDHASTDATQDIIRACPGPIEVERVNDPEFREMDFRRLMLERARMQGGTHFAIIDADEAITGNFLPRMREFAADLAPGYSFGVPMVALWRSLDRYRVDPGSCWSRSIMPVLFADHPALMWQPRADGYQLHGRQPAGVRGTFTPYSKPSQGGCFHWQWLDWDRLLWKQRHYVLRDALYSAKAVPPRVDPPEAINARYAQSVSEAGLVTQEVPVAWWIPYIDWRATYLDTTIRGWHHEDCIRMARELGPKGLRGLELWGWDPARDDI